MVGSLAREFATGNKYFNDLTGRGTVVDVPDAVRRQNAFSVRLFRARRRLREKMELSLQPKVRSMKSATQRGVVRPAAARDRRPLLGLNAAVTFASGD